MFAMCTKTHVQMYAILRDSRCQNENMCVKKQRLRAFHWKPIHEISYFLRLIHVGGTTRFRIDHYPLGLSEKSGNAGVIAKLNVIPMFDRLLACWGICDGQLAYLPTTN